MNIRAKIVLITLPLIITPLILTLVVSTLSARNGITVVATEFLTFKSEVLNNYIDSQWNLLVNNNLDKDSEYVSISQSSIETFSKTLTDSDTQKIFAVDSTGDLVIKSSDFSLTEDDKRVLVRKIENRETGWIDLVINNREVIAQTSFFEPFNWYVLVTVERSSFYGAIKDIFVRTIIIFVISLVVAVSLLMIFAGYLTKPLEKIVEAIKKIITTNDLSTKVELQYKDETGKLGHFFNIMTTELGKAYDQMKKFAFQAVVARHKETKIRNIFQKYVPKDVIDKFFQDPESMLVGENRVLSILFTDIRGFTTISEGLEPDQLVESLNKYFESMVNVITEHNGVVDKYMGDAIMAFFGAPVSHDDDALQSVLSGLDMIEKLDDFNVWQVKQGREKFNIGIGINYGIVTIGNIGSDKKMDYTIIGDMVNLASRIEGLTKVYKEPILITESLYSEVKDELPCRTIDKVVVKGKTQGVNIYSVRKSLDQTTRDAWDFHEEGIKHYYNRDFQSALTLFRKTKDLLPDDYISGLFIDRCHQNLKHTLDENWNGAVLLESK